MLANFWMYISECLGSEAKHIGWLNEEKFQQLPELIRDILMIWQWYAFYDHEGISVEQTITEDVIRILEYKLELKSFALDLKHLKTLMNQFYQEHSFRKMNFGKYLELKDQLVSKEYNRVNRKIEEMEELIMKKVYNLLYEQAATIDELLKTLNG